MSRSLVQAWHCQENAPSVRNVTSTRHKSSPPQMKMANVWYENRRGSKNTNFFGRGIGRRQICQKLHDFEKMGRGNSIPFEPQPHDPELIRCKRPFSGKVGEDPDFVGGGKFLRPFGLVWGCLHSLCKTPITGVAVEHTGEVHGALVHPAVLSRVKKSCWRGGSRSRFAASTYLTASASVSDCLLSHRGCWGGQHAQNAPPW